MQDALLSWHFKRKRPISCKIVLRITETSGRLRQSTYPEYRVFLRVHNAYIERCVPGAIAREGVPRIDPDNIEAVLEEIERDPTISIRMISRGTGISTATVHRSLREQQYYPCHFRKVQDLPLTDYEKNIL
ncbi:hypothetical protein EVAR_11479_1 [Eumeta japonica]|uniref:Transposase Tc1-like domain-containing protein n=1 Tax=Eumeta variegata TaxID=151549 RepID=A0A4C1TZ01_EUMVA|nr:hypothetical protein EVAR_11479_1 [Eumeta japonica]